MIIVAGCLRALLFEYLWFVFCLFVICCFCFLFAWLWLPVCDLRLDVFFGGGLDECGFHLLVVLVLLVWWLLFLF